METGIRLKEVKSFLPDTCCLVAVSKNISPEIILEAYWAGQRIFGENKVQELVKKFQELPKDIKWHMIGHLQSNKVKFIAPFIDTIQSVDSLKLLKVINQEAFKNGRIIKILFQLYIATEESKFGLSCDEIESILLSSEYAGLKNIKPVGLMGMASFTADQEQLSSEFTSLRDCFNRLKSLYFAHDPIFCELSMGMSSDYKVALQNGSTMVRIGSSIFGPR